MSYTNKQRDKIVNYINNCIIDERLHPGEKLPTENSLAETLGVSRVTVRRALDILEANGTIERIFSKGAFVKDNLPSQAQQIIIPFIAQDAEKNSRFFEIYSGVQDSFSKHNMQPLLSITGFNYLKERELILDFYQKGYRHMLLMSAISDKNVLFYLSMMQKGVDFVFIDKRPHKIPCDCITSNNFDGAYRAVNYLISQGHRKIAIYAPQSFKSASTNTERFNGYKSAMLQQNIYDSSLVFECPENEKLHEKFVDNILRNRPDVTALFVLSDFAAVPILRHLNERKARLSVFGFDNAKGTESTVPPLSTIEQPFYQLGYHGAQLLYERIVNPNKSYVVESLPIRIVIRDSVYPIEK